jgi:myosin heavy subunit
MMSKVGPGSTAGAVYSYSLSHCYVSFFAAVEWKDVQEAMKTLQFTPDMQSGMFQLLLAILNLGNVTFVSGTGSQSASCSVSPATKSFVDLSVSLLGVDDAMFSKALTEKKVKMGTDTVDILLNNVQAKDSIDSLTKALYSAMFDWVIKQANVSLSAPNPSAYFIGILDIFGFEVFEINRFEQLCINYANEKLQQHFNSVIFDEEMKMYASEGIDAGKNITFVDNSACVNLIEGKPFGLLSLLEEECSLGTATDFTYISKVDKEFGKGKKNENIYFLKHKTVPELFSVKHFAGAVEYNVVGILERNKDVLSDVSDWLICFGTPCIQFVLLIFTSVC